VCVVLAASGYPGEPQRGQAIGGLEEAAAMTATKVFHAGTMSSAGRVVTSGGRVLGVTAWGADLRVARDRAYAACEHIRFDGMQYRRDIGAKGLAVAG
jgi:phosphoribosylamine--glycine ligase